MLCEWDRVKTLVLTAAPKNWCLLVLIVVTVVVNVAISISAMQQCRHGTWEMIEHFSQGTL